MFELFLPALKPLRAGLWWRRCPKHRLVLPRPSNKRGSTAKVALRAFAKAESAIPALTAPRGSREVNPKWSLPNMRRDPSKILQDCKGSMSA